MEPQMGFTPPDWLLESIIQAVNKRDDLEFGLTVIVQGVMITGKAVSGRQYLREFGRQFDNLTDGETALATEFDAAAANLYPSPSPREDEEEKESQPPIRYLHMKNVRYLYPTANIELNFGFPYVRIDLTHVGAWHVGSA